VYQIELGSARQIDT